MHLFTLGYRAGWESTLLAHWAKRFSVLIVDIRLVPLSPRLEWNVGYLRELLGDHYVHVPELGNIHYRHRDQPIILSNAERGLKIVTSFLSRHSALALMCACATATTCHRTTVVQLLTQHHPSLHVTHLSPFVQEDRAHPRLFDPPTYLVPETAAITSCSLCGDPILWMTDPNGTCVPGSVAQLRYVSGQWYAPLHCESQCQPCSGAEQSWPTVQSDGSLPSSGDSRLTTALADPDERQGE